MRGSSIEGSGGGVPGILNIQIVKFPKKGLGSPGRGRGVRMYVKRVITIYTCTCNNVAVIELIP